MTDEQHHPGYGAANIWQQSRRSPIADLIDRHRAEMRRVWERHAEELSRAHDRAT